MLRGRRPLSEGPTGSDGSPATRVVGLRSVWLLGLALASLASLPALGLFGCTVPDEFDPSGGDIAVRATWTVQGQPASAESCAAAGMVDGEGGIGLVQLRIWEEYAGGTDYTEDGWIVPCSAGSLTTQPVLVPGTYRVGVYGITEQVDGGSFDTSEVTAAAIETVEAASGMVDVALDLVPED